MQTRRVSPLASIALAFAAGTAANAQTLVEPTFYVWGEYPYEARAQNSYPFSHPWMKKVVQPNLQFSLAEPNANANAPITWVGQPWGRPEAAALWIAKVIQFEISTAQRMASDKVTVVLQNFGMDNYLCDSTWNTNTGQANPETQFNTYIHDDNTPPNWYQNGSQASLRFYQSAEYPNGDRIAAINEWDNAANPFPKPRNRSLAGTVEGLKQARAGQGSGADYGSARSYRHPFIRNGKTTYQMINGKKVYDAPLKEWMNRFVDRLNDIYEHPSNYPELNGYQIPNPSTYRYYFDTEPSMCFFGDQNTVYMFQYLSKETNGFWNGPLLPGFNQTLQAHYNARRASFDGPVDHLELVLDPSLRPQAATNRALMRYYYELCQNVQDFIMDNCAYSVLREKWPNANVKCGNYEDYQVDGAVSDRFGWSQTRPWNTNLATTNIANPDWLNPAARTEMFPRLAMNKARGGPEYFFRPDAPNDTERLRYIYTKTTAHGTASSPSMYRVGRNEFYGEDGYGNDTDESSWFDHDPSDPFVTDATNDQGHRRWNIYAPRRTDWGHVGELREETPWETAVRIHRHNAESIINSVGGGSNKLVPWVQMCAVNPLDPNGSRLGDDFTTIDETRTLLMMLRAKNISEAMLWTGWSVKFPGQGADPAATEAWNKKVELTWRHTQQAVREVYEPRIDSYNLAHGDWDEYTIDPSKLEFTLRTLQSNQWKDRTVDMIALDHYATEAPHAYTHSESGLDVYVRWPEDNCNQSLIEQPVLIVGDRIAYVYVESAVTAPNAKMKVEIFDGTANWIELQPVEQYGDPDETVAHILTPQSADGMYHARMQFTTSTIDPCVIKYTLNNKRVSRIRVTHTCDTPFEVKHDLVQILIAAPVDRQLIEEESSAMIFRAASDNNDDGVVDAADAAQFVEDLSRDSGAADLNGDGMIDDADVELFISQLNGG